MIRNVLFVVMAITVALTAILRLAAENTVRAERSELARLERQQARLQAEIDRLHFEVEVLESAPRLNELSAGLLPLAPGSAGQMADDTVLRDVLDPSARLEKRR